MHCRCFKIWANLESYLDIHPSTILWQRVVIKTELCKWLCVCLALIFHQWNQFSILEGKSVFEVFTQFEPSKFTTLVFIYLSLTASSCNTHLRLISTFVGKKSFEKYLMFKCHCSQIVKNCRVSWSIKRAFIA